MNRFDYSLKDDLFTFSTSFWVRVIWSNVLICLIACLLSLGLWKTGFPCISHQNPKSNSKCSDLEIKKKHMKCLRLKLTKSYYSYCKTRILSDHFGKKIEKRTQCSTEQSWRSAFQIFPSTSTYFVMQQVLWLVMSSRFIQSLNRISLIWCQISNHSQSMKTEFRRKETKWFWMESLLLSTKWISVPKLHL